ncbi:hypothetical protein CMUS01_01360 [Colletotrichum musicola]|uniref:Uncharacterized protein n=1 Tax=Colletotrichum musicola TaxID=2175873 RepID=A0A8H6NX26_9PEZI|nr:hypothetical protein CMUS01_01360 [Colletotrichum musicola]
MATSTSTSTSLGSKTTLSQPSPGPGPGPGPGFLVRSGQFGVGVRRAATAQHPRRRTLVVEHRLLDAFETGEWQRHGEAGHEQERSSGRDTGQYFLWRTVKLRGKRTATSSTRGQPSVWSRQARPVSVRSRRGGFVLCDTETQWCNFVTSSITLSRKTLLRRIDLRPRPRQPT